MSTSIKDYWPIAGIVVIIAIVTSALLRPWSTPETELTFETSPHQVNITFDGEDLGEISHGQTLTVTADDQVTVEASQEGFVPDSMPITVVPGEAQTVHISLVPDSDQAEELIEEQDAVSQEQIVTEEYHDLAEDMHDTHPILQNLPQEGEFFGAYQGLSDSDDHDFGIHVHLYRGYEDQGRQEFEAWMQDAGYQVSDYLIVEDIQDEQPPTTPGDGPSWSQLESMQPQDISMPTVSADGKSVDELAEHFALVSTTWDAGEDIHHTDGLIRAKPLMTDELADTVETPHRPTPSQSWWTAYEYEATSYPWIIEHESLEHQEASVATMSVCWAWIGDDMEPVIDGPRTMEATIDGSDGIIEDFYYVDPDDFVDDSGSPCIPEDAP